MHVSAAATRRRAWRVGLVVFFLLAVPLPAWVVFWPAEQNAEATMASSQRPGLPRLQTGLASYYGGRFHGRETASGEIFNRHEMVAAHRRYPFGTVVRVTNLENGRKVRVRITDRGPYGANRRKGTIIDLSVGAARRLDMLEDGITRVRVEVLEWGDGERVQTAGE
jgi:rare lipoprotein A